VVTPEARGTHSDGTAAGQLVVGRRVHCDRRPGLCRPTHYRLQRPVDVDGERFFSNSGSFANNRQIRAGTLYYGRFTRVDDHEFRRPRTPWQDGSRIRAHASHWLSRRPEQAACALWLTPLRTEPGEKLVTRFPLRGVTGPITQSRHT